jgi:hypothetical protein
MQKRFHLPEAPMTPKPDELEADPRFPSGKWQGFWTDHRIRGRPKMELVLTFVHGEIHGEGRDYVGKFLIRGRYATADGKCHWTKKYIAKHDVFYQGFNEGKGIWGTWELPSLTLVGERGGFHIWPEGMADPTQPVLHAEADIPVEAKEKVEVGEPVGVS